MRGLYSQAVSHKTTASFTLDVYEEKKSTKLAFHFSDNTFVSDLLNSFRLSNIKGMKYSSTSIKNY